MNKLQIHITTPCHEQWANMTPADKGRLCEVCEKKVVDFTGMSDHEIVQFFKQPSNGSVCGRFMNGQLDRTIEIPKKRIPWLRYFFQFTWPALMLALKGCGDDRSRTLGEPNVKLEQVTIPVDTSKTIMGDSIVLTKEGKEIYPHP